MTNTQSTKHTPGPWRADDNQGYWMVYAPDGSGVAHVAPTSPDDGPDPEAEANAKLIAQAPAMAEALAALLATAKVANIAGQSLYKADVVVQAEQVLRDAGVLA